ncbi:hypothetical protein [Symbioplanes lichenis]|uniref:hypothetical protein n=1 Tax=Symbioplanes lichenis TaxID=1629072 RepID=UPI0027391CA9|nr:hypothetical protein [Actinoplanes lichenis]
MLFVGDFPLHLVQAPPRPRPARLKAVLVGLVTLAMCLFLAGATPRPAVRTVAWSIPGMDALGSPPVGRSKAPAPVVTHGLSSVATADEHGFALHTAGGDITFLTGVNLGSTTPGHLPGELAITAEQYRRWFAAMGWLGLRVVRIATIHPPAFYRELVAFNRANPGEPLYLMQGVSPAELRDAHDAVHGGLKRGARPGRASGTWDTDAGPWLTGWIIDPEAAGEEEPEAAGEEKPEAAGEEETAGPARGKWFRSAPSATPGERRLAARMDELAGYEAAAGYSPPIAAADGEGTNHMTSTWPGGTFASYAAYPFWPDSATRLLSYRYQGRADPYAGYVAALRQRHSTMPTLVTEFGVPSAIGSAHDAPLGRSEGDHSEREAMAIDAELLRLLKDQGLAGGFLAGWADEWFRSSWNTAGQQDGERRQLWHDPLTAAQGFGLIAMDAAGSPDAGPQQLLDDDTAWPARRVTARVDESYVHLRVRLGSPTPAQLTLGFDVLPGVHGPPAPGSGNRAADAAFELDVTRRAGQAYLRKEGWRRFQPAGQDTGLLRFGPPEEDSRALWHRDGDDLVVRVPWGMLGYTDPSKHMIGAVASPGVGVTVSASGTDLAAGHVTWTNWNRVYHSERLKPGADVVRDAVLETAS